MLVLSRHRDEAVVIDLRKWGLGLIRAITVDIRGDKTRQGFEADPQIPVHREEVFAAIESSGGERKVEPRPSLSDRVRKQGNGESA